jgi:hypothetical protein
MANQWTKPAWSTHSKVRTDVAAALGHGGDNLGREDHVEVLVSDSVSDAVRQAKESQVFPACRGPSHRPSIRWISACLQANSRA